MSGMAGVSLFNLLKKWTPDFVHGCTYVARAHGGIVPYIPCIPPSLEVRCAERPKSGVTWIPDHALLVRNDVNG